MTRGCTIYNVRPAIAIAGVIFIYISLFRSCGKRVINMRFLYYLECHWTSFKLFSRYYFCGSMKRNVKMYNNNNK